MVRLTNFKIKELPKYQLAINRYNLITGRYDLVIKDEAFDNSGDLLGISYKSLHALDISSKSDFWDIFYNIDKSIS